MGRGLGKIQRIILHALSQHPSGLLFSKLKRMVPEDISKTKGFRPCHPKFVAQRKFDHNIYMALKALAKRGLIEIDPPSWAWNRIYRITQIGIDYINYLSNVKITLEDSTKGKSLYEIMEETLVEGTFNLRSLIEMGYTLTEIRKCKEKLQSEGRLSEEQLETIHEQAKKLLFPD